MTEIKYDRQGRIDGWDQKKLENTSIAIIGAGALGNHVTLGLIGLGIGTIKIFDFDLIEAHNLNRQSLFCEEDIGRNKAEVLAERLEERNSSLIIVGIDEKIEEDTIDTIIRNVDVVVDCVDLISVRRILNRFCLRNNIPLVHGGISWLGGQTGVITRRTPCINCIFPKDIQEQEIHEETSCIRKPQPSVVYSSQIIAGFMVKLIRQTVLPLPSDPPLPSGLLKLDFRFEVPLYYEATRRLDDCECRDILLEVEPQILKKEEKAERNRKKEEMNDIASVIADEK